ncbi:MAG: DUF2652 domain-containing protein [Anaerolineales bacterium]|nr:DUF2652 domain-containing protein [Anaerolineales bacterium]
MAKKGFFILTDISGYTEFLTKSELDHAQDALQSLFDVQIANIRHPFVISGFRGDAIFMYVPETNICAPQTFLEALENLYFVFADTLRQMNFNTTCTCRACRNMAKLDLKMVIHYGEYAIQKLGGREELLGADVIIPHRMLKNHIIEQTGIESYALFSEQAANTLNLSELASPLISYTESYEHIGKINMQILDLRKVWETEQERNRVVISPAEAWLVLEMNFPVPPSTLWEYLTVPHLEKLSSNYDLVERTDSLGGRYQQETTYHCAHGETHFFNTILDWKPFEYYTLRQKISIGFDTIQTRRLTQTEAGTRLSFFIKHLGAEPSEEMKQIFIGAYDETGKSVLNHLETDVADGVITVTESINNA